MERFVQTLVAVVEANQRFLLRRIATQLFLLFATGVGLWKLSSGWWWLALFFFLLFCLNTVMFTLTLLTQLTVKVSPPWRALGLQPLAPGAWGAKDGSRTLELHLLEGGTSWLPVPARMVPDVSSAAHEAGLEVITDEEGLKELNWQSDRIRTLRKINLLSGHVPSPELREEIGALVLRLRELEPRGGDELLRQLEIQLRAERTAQTTTSLRGPRTVYEKEITEQLARLRELLAETEAQRAQRSATT